MSESERHEQTEHCIITYVLLFRGLEARDLELLVHDELDCWVGDENQRRHQTSPEAQHALLLHQLERRRNDARPDGGPRWWSALVPPAACGCCERVPFLVGLHTSRDGPQRLRDRGVDGSRRRGNQ